MQRLNFPRYLNFTVNKPEFKILGKLKLEIVRAQVKITGYFVVCTWHARTVETKGFLTIWRTLFPTVTRVHVAGHVREQWEHLLQSVSFQTFQILLSFWQTWLELKRLSHTAGLLYQKCNLLVDIWNENKCISNLNAAILRWCSTYVIWFREKGLRFKRIFDNGGIYWHVSPSVRELTNLSVLVRWIHEFACQYKSLRKKFFLASRYFERGTPFSIFIILTRYNFWKGETKLTKIPSVQIYLPWLAVSLRKEESCWIFNHEK